MSASTTTLNYSLAPAKPPTIWIHRFSILVAVCTFVLILAGSMVTTTGSGLAVPDWPTTYEQNMFTYPPSKWVGGILYEHVHRLMGASVGLLTLVLCIWIWCSNFPRRAKWLGTAALLVVCFQGLLGGLTVIFMLPTWLSVAHAGLAELFFCIAITLAVISSPHRHSNIEHSQVVEKSKLRRSCVAVLLCVYLQLLLGAVMRHTHSGLAITDFPASYGSVFPPTSSTELEAINIDRVWEADLEEVTLGQVWIHFAHRLGAIAVVIAVIALCRRVLNSCPNRSDLVLWCVVLTGLLLLQILLGAMTIWSKTALSTTTAHVGVGALMLANSLMLVLCAFRPFSRPSTTFIQEPLAWPTSIAN